MSYLIPQLLEKDLTMRNLYCKPGNINPSGATDRRIALNDENKEAFPQYSITTGETQEGSVTKIDLALPGYGKDYITVTFDRKADILEVVGKRPKPDDTDVTYQHNSIQKYNFKKFFSLPSGSRVEDVSYTDGILAIKVLQIVVPAQPQILHFLIK